MTDWNKIVAKAKHACEEAIREAYDDEDMDPHDAQVDFDGNSFNAGTVLHILYHLEQEFEGDD